MSPRAPVPYSAGMTSPTVPRHRRTIALLVALTVAATSLAAAAPGSAAPAGGSSDLALTQVATLASPIAMTTRTGSTDLFVAERAGVVRVLHVNAGVVTVDPTPLLDITGYISTASAGGLYSLAFDPTGSRLYVHFTNTAGNNRLVEYTMSGGGTGPTVDLSTRRVVLKQPQGTTYHKGGDIAFGPDGRLYLALGDGDSLGAPLAHGQDRTTTLGKILRINPRAATNRPYRNPLGNPFFNEPGSRREIWIYGVRNPWRMSFDRATGDLYISDVGEDNAEEVNVLLADGDGRNAGRGANLGWSLMEGTLPFNGGTEPSNHTRPVFTYDHTGGDCSIIGGYVYRGTAVPGLDGRYVYGDRCTGRIGTITIGGPREAAPETSSVPDLGISAPGGQLQSFGQGPDGEIYVLTHNSTTGVGAVLRIDPAAP